MTIKKSHLENRSDIHIGFSEYDLKLLQRIARDQVFEPFTGKRSLETIQKTRTGLEKGIDKLKNAGGKVGDWVNQSGISNKTQNKLSYLFKNIKETNARISVSELLGKLNQATEEIQKLAKKGYSSIEEKTKRLTIAFLEKGLELLIYEDTTEWILKRANKCLERSDITNIDQIQQLLPGERLKLIQSLYPYDSPAYNSFMKRFDVSLNVALGAVVATNIPGTGIAVSVVNMGKTIFKMGNRLNIMSAIYGKKIASPEALFKASARIIASLEDWENNDQHVPLDPDVLEDLYFAESEEDPSAFRELLSTVVRKDAYIAIPGVGMISLGKINLDDFKMDLVVQHLVINYAEKERLIEAFGNSRVNAVLTDFHNIFREFKARGYFKIMREKLEKTRSSSIPSPKWHERLKNFAGTDITLETISKNLDISVLEIFQTTQHMQLDEKANYISSSVQEFFDEISCL